jgi:hypothetical protein
MPSKPMRLSICAAGTAAGRKGAVIRRSKANLLRMPHRDRNNPVADQIQLCSQSNAKTCCARGKAALRADAQNHDRLKLE